MRKGRKAVDARPDLADVAQALTFAQLARVLVNAIWPDLQFVP